jgi:hypothetical protein
MTPASSGMSTSAYATASVSKPLAFTGAASVVSVQGGLVAMAAAVFFFFLPFLFLFFQTLLVLMSFFLI